MHTVPTPMLPIGVARMKPLRNAGSCHAKPPACRKGMTQTLPCSFPHHPGKSRGPAPPQAPNPATVMPVYAGIHVLPLFLPPRPTR